MYRVLLDRAHSELDGIFHSLDSHTEGDFAASPSPPPPPLPESSSYSNTSFPTSSSQTSASSPDLRQILQNIKSCRWRHFKPRTLKSQSDTRSSSSHCGLRGFSRSLTTALGSGINIPNRGAATINSSLGEFVCMYSHIQASPVWVLALNTFIGEEYHNKFVQSTAMIFSLVLSFWDGA